MTLARILTTVIFCAACSSAQNVAALNSVAQDQSPPAQASSPAQAPASPTPEKSPGQNSTPPHKLRHHKRKTASTDCASAATPASAGNATAASAPSTISSNCPPAKVVVHNGGSPEPSIQLTGGDAPAQSASATELFGKTEENLKKIDAHSLSASQQETVNQIHQFMDQSKAAVAAGDAERARTLALKAQMLSEELIKPQK